MPYLYLKVSFYKSLKANVYPSVSVNDLDVWDGKQGTYRKGDYPCYVQYLNHVVCIDDFYTYEMVVTADINDFKTINESVQFAFNKVKEYVEQEAKERDQVFKRYQEFLDTGGFPIRTSEHTDK